jgi:hypothetical protein
VEKLNGLVATLKRATTDSDLRGPLVGVVRDDGDLDVRVPPAALVESPRAFICALRAGIREADASAIGVVLPVRSVWGEDQICDYPDAEALILVAAEDLASGVTSVGLRCAVHALPGGWEEAHDTLQWIARPLRAAIAGRPIEEHERT